MKQNSRASGSSLQQGMQTYTAAFNAAAARLGSREALARHLRSPMPSELQFLRCVEILIADDEQLEQFRHAAMTPPPVVLDAAERRAYIDGSSVPLAITEWSVLESLSARIGQPVSRAQIRRELALWTGKALADGLHMYIFRLRLKLAPAGLRIRTVPRSGYVLQPA